MNSYYTSFFANHLDALRTEGRYRTFINLIRQTGDAPYATHIDSNGQEQRVVVWCSNDYLGMSQHNEVIKVFKETATSYGVGSGGTRNIAGSCNLHRQLEENLANLHSKQGALLFSSGYVANEATLSALGKGLPNCVFLSDAKNHASMIQGIRHSQAEKIIFKHNDLADLGAKLQSINPERPKIIAIVSIYSMDGDFAPLREICELAKRFNALVYLDEVHAMGIYGPKGNGLAAAQGLTDQIDIIQGNFAKAYGVVGGYIAGPRLLVDYVRSCGSGFIFTTSIPPAVAAAANKSIEILTTDHTLRDKLWQNVIKLKTELKNQLRKTTINFIDSPSHIIPIVVGDAFRCQQLAKDLLSKFNIYVQPINYPTVPRGQERFRLTVTPHHTFEMISQLVAALKMAAEFV